MEKQLRTKRKAVQLNSVNHLRQIILSRIAEKKITKYRAACDMNIQHLTFRNITKESDSGFNVEFLIKIMKYLNINICIDNDEEDAPRVSKSQLLKDRPHNKKLYAELIELILKYNEINFNSDLDSYVNLTLSSLDNTMLIIVYASDEYMYDIVYGIKSALLKLDLKLLEEQTDGNARYFIKWQENG